MLESDIEEGFSLTSKENKQLTVNLYTLYSLSLNRGYGVRFLLGVANYHSMGYSTFRHMLQACVQNIQQCHC